MPLILKVLSYRDSVPEQPIIATFEKVGGSIGRRANNDWTLPDPERFISGRHARISYSDERYAITDTSSNGVFINHAEQRLGNGNSVELHDGDELTIGDYEISVSISPEPAEKVRGIEEPEDFEDPFARVGPAEAEKALETPFADEEFEKTKAVPFPSAGEFSQRADLEAPYPELTPFLEVPTPETGPESDHVSELEEHFPLPQPIPDEWDLGGERPGAEPAIPGEKQPPAAPAAQTEPLAEEPEQVPAQPSAESAERVQGIEESEDFADPFAGVVPAEAEQALETPFADEEFEKTQETPLPSPAEQSPLPQLIPEGWDLDWDREGKLPGTEPAITNEKVPPVPPPARTEPLAEEPKQMRAKPAVGPEEAPGGFAGTGPLPSPGIRPGSKARPAVPYATTTTTDAGRRETSVEEDQKLLLAALSKGLGLSETAIREESLARLLEHMGHLMRECTQGTMELLRARANMKGEFRMSQTSIQPGKNNPLKILVNADEALIHLINPTPSTGYLPPLGAVHEAYDDVEAHLLAVVAGMQAALHSVLTRFNPEVLEQRLVKMMVVDKYIPLYKHAKTWELFTEEYSKIAGEAEDDFQNLFGKAFTKAYEVQIKRLQALKRERGTDET